MNNQYSINSVHPSPVLCVMCVWSAFSFAGGEEEVWERRWIPSKWHFTQEENHTHHDPPVHMCNTWTQLPFQGIHTYKDGHVNMYIMKHTIIWCLCIGLSVPFSSLAFHCICIYIHIHYWMPNMQYIVQTWSILNIRVW